MRLSTTFFLLALAVIVTAGCTTRGSRLNRHSRFGPLKQNCTANRGANDCGCNTCQSHQPSTGQYATTLPAQEFSGHQEVVASYSGSESLVARLNRLNGNAYGLQSSQSVTAENQPSAADQVVIAQSVANASTATPHPKRKRTRADYQINDVVKYDNLRLPITSNLQSASSESSSRMVGETNLETPLNVQFESREEPAMVDSAHHETELVENRSGQLHSNGTSHTESHLNIAPLAQGLTEELLNSDSEPSTTVVPLDIAAQQTEPHLDQVETLNLISKPESQASRRSSTIIRAPKVEPIVSKAFTGSADSVLIVDQKEAANPQPLFASDATPKIHVKSEDAKSLQPSLKRQSAEIEPAEPTPIVSTEVTPVFQPQTVDLKIAELAAAPVVRDALVPAKSGGRVIKHDEKSSSHGITKVHKPIILRATVNQRDDFIDTITQQGPVAQNDRPHVSRQMTLPNTAIEMKMESIDFRPLPSQSELALPAVDSSARLQFQSLPVSNGFSSVGPQVAEPKNSMIVATSKVAVVGVDERDSQAEGLTSTAPTVRIEARFQSAPPVQENVMGILKSNTRRLTAPSSTTKPPMIQASVKKRIFESKSQVIPDANHQPTNPSKNSSSATDLLRSESANLFPGQRSGILRLRARTGQPNGHSLPPIINISTSDSPIRIRAREGKPSATFNRFNIVPGVFDSNQLPSTKNAPMLDDPIVDESIRRLSVRPESSSHTKLKTIER